MKDQANTSTMDDDVLDQIFGGHLRRDREKDVIYKVWIHVESTTEDGVEIETEIDFGPHAEAYETSERIDAILMAGQLQAIAGSLRPEVS